MVWNLLLGVSFCVCFLCCCWLLHCCLWFFGCLTLFKLFSCRVVGLLWLVFVVMLGSVDYRFIEFVFTGLIVACLGFCYVAVGFWTIVAVAMFGLLVMLFCNSIDSVFIYYVTLDVTYAD